VLNPPDQGVLKGYSRGTHGYYLSQMGRKDLGYPPDRRAAAQRSRVRDAATRRRQLQHYMLRRSALTAAVCNMTCCDGAR
jgi:hypothetical protein